MSGIIVIVLVLGVIALLRAKMGDASYEKMVLMLFGVDFGLFRNGARIQNF